jgi:hypothetical protein
MTRALVAEYTTLKRIEKRMSVTSIRRVLLILQNRIDECRRFYPWPALIESLEADKARLIARLESMKT